MHDAAPAAECQPAAQAVQALPALAYLPAAHVMHCVGLDGTTTLLDVATTTAAVPSAQLTQSPDATLICPGRQNAQSVAGCASRAVTPAPHAAQPALAVPPPAARYRPRSHPAQMAVVPSL